MLRISDLSIGTTLENRYKLVQKLGEGGCAVIWEVEDLETNGDHKAIKVCKSHDFETVLLLRQEFVTLERLQKDSKNEQANYIVQVEKLYPLNKPHRDDRIPLHFFVMERITGCTLEDLILNSLQDQDSNYKNNFGRSLYQFLFYRYPPLRSHISYLQIANWLEQLTKILQYLHSQQIIYCDLKPANIMITDDGNIKLIDLGVIKIIEDKNLYLKEVATQSVKSGFTLDYAAPEQMCGQSLLQSDFYGFGYTVLFALTGKNPSKLEPNWRSQFPPQLCNFLNKATQEDPLKRHPDADNLLKEAKQVGRSLRHQFGRWAVAKQMMAMAGTAAIATVSTLALRSTGILQPVELIAYDQMLRMRPDFSEDRRILIVAIQPQDYEWMQGRDIPNYVLTKSIQNLLSHKPRAIGFAIARDQPNNNGIAELKQVLESNNNIFGSCEANSNQGRGFSFEPKPSTPLGFGEVLVDKDNYNRRQVLFYPDHPNAAMVDDPCPAQFSFNLIVANYYLNNQPDHRQSIKNKIYLLGSQKLQRLQSESIYQGIGIEDEAFDDTFQIMIDYRSLDRLVTKVAIKDILDNRIAPDLIRDRLVLMGRLNDLSMDRPHLTPYGEMSTVELRSQVIGQLIGIGEARRSGLRLANWKLDFGVGVFVATFTSFLSWRITSRRGKSVVFISIFFTMSACCWLVLSTLSIYLGFIPFLIIFILAFFGEYSAVCLLKKFSGLHKT